MVKTGIVRDDRYMNHRPGIGHPESHQRLEVVYAMLGEPDMADKFTDVKAREATEEELLLVHTQEYVNFVASTAGKSHSSLDPDTSTSEESYEAALLAAGGLCEAVSGVISGEIDNAMALVRPPGHHAEKNRAMGFCLFNNVAVGARYAQEFHNLEKILIIDWDLHHGNGTQHSFETDPSVLYFSTHQYPYYPGTGAFREVGGGDGEGYTVNVPLSVGNGDIEYINIFEKVLRPVAVEYEPELILVSAGFDIYRGDPLGGMGVTPKGFAALTRSIMGMAEECCNGKVVITLEGGYDLTGLRDSTKEVLKELRGVSNANMEEFLSMGNTQKIDSALEQVYKFQKRYWKNLG